MNFFSVLLKYPVRAALAAALLAAAVFLFIKGGGNGNIRTETVRRGTIQETVTVTGKTKPVHDLNLSFEKSGRVARIAVAVGDRVAPGQTLVELESSELQAELAQSKANLLAEQAKLDELRRGSRPEEVKIKETELKKAEQDLANDFASVPDTLNDAFAKADDAVRKQLDQLFSDDETNPLLTFLPKNSQLKINLEQERTAASRELNLWKDGVAGLGGTPSNAALKTALAAAKTHLDLVRKLLNDAMDAVSDAVGLSQATSDLYRGNITTARTNVNTAIASVASSGQTIASQELSVQKIRDELSLALAGSAPEELAAQEARVAQAEAAVKLNLAQLSKTVMRSPIAGLITKQDANLGEIAGANSPLVAVISENDLEIEANVPEVDIGKIKIADPVVVTLDAFPRESFRGTVVSVDPAETIVDGVVNFKIKVSFDKADPRVKSGLTANLEIKTQTKENVLVLPQFAIIENDRGTFVKKVSGAATEEIRVTTGIRSSDGFLEILSGLSAGDAVLNVGVKTNGGK